MITLNKFKQSMSRFILRKRVRRMDFSIVSANCWGSSIYEDLHLPYNTPFVGLFIYAPCFLKLLGDLENYMRSKLSFTKDSRYSVANEKRLAKASFYPIGILGGDVEIHFLHYKDEQEAFNKWEARRQRLNMNNLFIGFTDRDLCEDIHLREFDRISFPHKVVFTAKHHYNLQSSIWLREYDSQPYIGDIYTYRHIYKRHFDVADWLNGGSGRATLPYRLISRMLEIQKAG